MWHLAPPPPCGTLPGVNVLFISPNFPPQFWLFCAALRAEGATVLAIGDAPAHELSAQLAGSLHEYVCVPGMGQYASGLYPDIHRAVAYLISRHGRLDRIESLNEYWLPLEALLREDYNVPGPRPAELLRHRSKTGMREIFRRAGVPCTEGEPIASKEQVHAFAERHGFPLVLKPDIGVGAARTYRVEDLAALDEALGRVGRDYLVEAFAHGTLCSYDGLLDRSGHVVFETSHVFSSGVMDIVNQGLDVYYYSRREIPPELVALGRRAVSAFALREQFFHTEWFDQGGGRFRALEINLRPPGGFTTDMMNYASEIDVYSLWAKVLMGRDLSSFQYERKYCAAYASRRFGRRYELSVGSLRALLGDRLVLEREMPQALSGAMGNYMFLLRSPDEQAVLEAIRLVVEPEG